MYIDLYIKFFKTEPILNNNTISEDDKISVYDKILEGFATDFYKLAKGSGELDNEKIENIILSMREDNSTKNKINEIFTKMHEVTKLHNENKIDTTKYINKKKTNKTNIENDRQIVQKNFSG